MNDKRNKEIRQVFILLGSNIDPNTNMMAAIKLLDEKLQISKLSKLYRTPAVGVSEPQPNYLNAVVMIMWSKSIIKLRDILRSIEQRLGRQRFAQKFAPRTIDLDILLFGKRIFDTDEIQIPDPDILRYPFGLHPLCDIAPHFIHPVEKKSLAQLLQEIEFDIPIEVVKLPEFDMFNAIKK